MTKKVNGRENLTIYTLPMIDLGGKIRPTWIINRGAQWHRTVRRAD